MHLCFTVDFRFKAFIKYFGLYYLISVQLTVILNEVNIFITMVRHAFKLCNLLFYISKNLNTLNKNINSAHLTVLKNLFWNAAGHGTSFCVHSCCMVTGIGL